MSLDYLVNQQSVLASVLEHGYRIEAYLFLSRAAGSEIILLSSAM